MSVAVLAACTPAESDDDDPYCADLRAQLTSYDVSTGEPRWTRRLPHPHDRPASVPGDHLVLRGCGVTAVDLAHGQTVLKRRDATGFVGFSGGYTLTLVDGAVEAEPTGDGSTRSWHSTPPYDAATVIGNLLLLQRGDRVTVHDASSGRQKWQVTLPTLGDGATFHLGFEWLVVRADDGSIYGLHLLSGAELEIGWRAVPPAPDVAYGDVLTVAPKVVVTSAGDEPDRYLVGLDVSTGEELWRLPAAGVAERPDVAVTGGVLAVRSEVLEQGRPGLTAVGLRDGRARWRRDADVQMVVGTADVFATAEEDRVVALGAATGRQLWTVPTRHPPLLTAAAGVVVLDTLPVPHQID